MDSLTLHTYRSGKECREETLRLESKGYSYVPFDVTGGTKAAFFEGDASIPTCLTSWHFYRQTSTLCSTSRRLSPVQTVRLSCSSVTRSHSRRLTPSAALRGGVALGGRGGGCRFAPRRCPLYTFSNRAEYDRLARLASDGSGYQVFTLQGLSQRTSEFSAALENSEIEVFIDLTSEAARRREASIHRASRFGAKRPHFLVSEARSAKVFENFPSLSTRSATWRICFPNVPKR